MITALSVERPLPLQQQQNPPLPPSFDTAAALALAGSNGAASLPKLHPDRSPGTSGAVGAAGWFAEQMAPYGFTPDAKTLETQTFTASIPAKGEVKLRNVYAIAHPTSPAAGVIVVMAHRDNTGAGPGANDNASGTAALIELARAYAQPKSEAGRGVAPKHTIVFLSTDGGAFGGLGADYFAAHSPFPDRIIAVINLVAVAGAGLPRLEIGGDQARSPAEQLVETAAVRIAEQDGGSPPGRTSALGQLIDLAFPFSLYEQAPFVGRGIPAVTLTTAGDRPPSSATDRTDRLVPLRLGQLGRAAQTLLGSIDSNSPPQQGSTSYLYLRQRFVRGWGVELTLIAMLLPFALAAVDLWARCRRRRVSVAPALRAYRSRLGFWLWVGALFLFFAVIGVWPGGDARPVNPETAAAGNWPMLGLVGLAILVGLSWLVPRQRLRKRRPVLEEEELAGYAGTLVALGVVALVVAAINPFALLFVLPSLHAWLWLPQLRNRANWVQALVLLAGFTGPLLLLGSLAGRFGLGFDAPWYLAELTAIGYVPIVGIAVFLAWTAAASQLVVLTLGRYAPYPSAAERPPRGPLRNAVRAVALAVIHARRARQARETEGARRALEG